MTDHQDRTTLQERVLIVAWYGPSENEASLIHFMASFAFAR